MRRRLLLAATSVTALLLASPSPIRAQGTVTCLNCATWMDYDQKWVWDGVQWAKNLEQQVLQVQQEIQTAVNTLNFYKNSLQNTAGWPLSVYHDVTADIQNIQGLINRATMLQGFAKQMLTNLSNSTGYPDSQLGSANWEVIVAKENQALSLAMTQAAQAISDQGPQLTADAATLAQLQQEAMSADGRQKALQTIAGTNATVGQMIQKSQQTTAATQQAMMTYFTAQADRQSLLDGWNHVQLYGVISGACAALTQTGYTTDSCAGGNNTGGAPNTP